MKTLGVTDLNDLSVVDGNLAILVDAEACAQSCTQAASSIRGEFIFDIEKGIPYMETAFLTSRPNQLEAALRSTLQSVPNVIGVEEFALIQNGEIIQYEAVLNTVYGEVVVNG